MELQPLETTRHEAIFNPDEFGLTPVHVIGCGATGSKVALELAKLGVQELHCYDFDTVEPHNVPNQMFSVQHIGAPKVMALASVIYTFTGTKIFPYNEKVTGSTPLDGIVFLLTDTMSSRKEIWDGAIRMNPGVRLMVETRMGVNSGRIYTINPSSLNHVRFWEETLCDDEEAEESECGGKTVVGPTASIVSGWAVWQFLRWWQGEKDYDKRLKTDTEIMFELDSVMTITTAVAP